jgi:hypothetical protein
MTELEYHLIKQKSDMYADGNMSEWMRYAATKLIPKIKDIDVEDNLEGNPD